MNEPIKVGDMVVLVVDVPRGSWPYNAGLRRGSVGVVTGIGSYEAIEGRSYPLMIDWANTDTRKYLFVAHYCEVRRIPPPERGNWDDCAWRPTLIYGLPS